MYRRRGVSTQTLVILTITLVIVTAGLAAFLIANEGQAPSATVVTDRSAREQRRSAQTEIPAPDPKQEANAPRETFGSLPNEVMGSDPPAAQPAEEAAKEAAQEIARATPEAPENPGAVERPIERAVPPPERPQLEPGFVAALRKRAAEAMSRNDVTAARLLLQRASIGRDADALEDLARTYDPAVLERMGLRNIFPGDPQIAAKLYSEAQQARAASQTASPR